MSKQVIKEVFIGAQMGMIYLEDSNGVMKYQFSTLCSHIVRSRLKANVEQGLGELSLFDFRSKTIFLHKITV